MTKYNIISDWMNATLSVQMRNTLQAFADGAARDQGLDVQPGDIVRWSLKSSGKMGLAVFRPEQAELPKARSKAPVASPVELPAGITPEVLAQALAIAASKTTIAGEQPVPFIAPEMLPQLLAMIEGNKAKGKAKRKA